MKSVIAPLSVFKHTVLGLVECRGYMAVFECECHKKINFQVADGLGGTALYELSLEHREALIKALQDPASMEEVQQELYAVADMHRRPAEGTA